ncbi:MAG TPA: PAS domain S-box protein [Acidobacteria bacterium]|nr:PAS domain S-box protein [Acidobacteriota bacterium]
MQDSADAASGSLFKELRDIQYALDRSAIVATTDVAGKITATNQKFRDISGYSESDLLGQDHRIINSGHHSKEFFRNLWSTIVGGEVWTGELCNRAKNGNAYWVDTTIVPFLDDAGVPYQYMAIRFEITGRKRAETKLREQETLARLGEMAAVVAHEVKNPLAGIRGALQVISGRMPADAPDVAVLGDIQDRIDGLDQMVQDLLVFARPTPPTMGQTALLPLISGTVSMLSQDSAWAGVEIVVPETAPTLRVDAAQLQVVLFNLLLNAAQAVGGDGRVEVAVDTTPEWCEIRVGDDGPGLDPAVRDRLFEPFITTKHRGSGLGLATAKRVVEMHHGTLVADSGPNGGTVLSIRLPVE